MRPTHWSVMIRLKGDFTMASIGSLVDELRKLNKGGLVGAVQVADGVQLELTTWAPQSGTAVAVALGFVHQLVPGDQIFNVEALTHEVG